MGNGSMKSKRYKHTDSSARASNSWTHKDGGGFKNSSLDSLRARVDELEREGKRRDEELCAKEQQIRSLQEQLAKQTRALAELSEELQNKCIQLNKLQDVMKNQGAASVSLPSRPPSIRTAGKSSPNLSIRIKETLNRRKGAKAGVSAEPTSRTYDSSSLPKFSFEKARVPKDARWGVCFQGGEMKMKPDWRQLQACDGPWLKHAGSWRRFHFIQRDEVQNNKEVRLITGLGNDQTWIWWYIVFLSFITQWMYYLCTSRYKQAEVSLKGNMSWNPSDKKNLISPSCYFIDLYRLCVARFVLHRQEVDQIKEVSWSKMLCHGDVKTWAWDKEGHQGSFWIGKKCSVIASSKGWRGRFSNHLNLSVPPLLSKHLLPILLGFFLHWCLSVEKVYKSKRQIGQKTKVRERSRQNETNASSSSWLFNLPSTLCSPVNTCCPHLPTTLSSDWAFSRLCPSLLRSVLTQ